MGSRGATLAAAITGGLNGYMRGMQFNDEKSRTEEDRAMRKQEFDARMGEVNDRKNLKMSLADAARPVTVESGAGGMIRPETMDNRDVGLAENAGQPNGGLGLSQFRVKDKSYETQALADTAAATQNAPDAVAQRQGLAYRQAGRPDQALDIEQKQAKITNDQATYARKLKEEGVFEAIRALRAGDASGMATVFNSSGQHKLEGIPEITRDERDVPGIGKIPTYTAKMRMKGPDGQIMEKTVNSHDLSMQMMPYEKALDLQRKGSDSDNKFTYQAGMLDAKGKQIELQGELGAARVAAAGAKTNGQPSREERLRYTSLFQDAGRRASEAQKALTSLQKDPMYSMAKEGSQQYAELQGLREAIKSHQEERTLYQGMLAGSQGREAPSSAAVGLSSARSASPATQSAVASPRPAAPGLANARTAAPAKPGYSHLWK